MTFTPLISREPSRVTCMENVHELEYWRQRPDKSFSSLINNQQFFLRVDESLIFTRGARNKAKLTESWRDSRLLLRLRTITLQFTVQTKKTGFIWFTCGQCVFQATEHCGAIYISWTHIQPLWFRAPQFSNNMLEQNEVCWCATIKPCPSKSLGIGRNTRQIITNPLDKLPEGLDILRAFFYAGGHQNSGDGNVEKLRSFQRKRKLVSNIHTDIWCPPHTDVLKGEVKITKPKLLKLLKE